MFLFGSSCSEWKSYIDLLIHHVPLGPVLIKSISHPNSTTLHVFSEMSAQYNTTNKQKTCSQKCLGWEKCECLHGLSCLQVVFDKLHGGLKYWSSQHHLTSEGSLKAEKICIKNKYSCKRRSTGVKQMRKLEKMTRIAKYESVLFFLDVQLH